MATGSGLGTRLTYARHCTCAGMIGLTSVAACVPVSMWSLLRHGRVKLAEFKKCTVQPWPAGHSGMS